MSFIKKIIDITSDEYYCRCRLFNAFNLFSFQKNAQDRYMFKILWQRFTITKRRLKQEQIIELNKVYENGDLNNKVVPKVISSRDTLNELMSTNKSIVRYGDGEFNLVFGEDLPFQKYSKKLAHRMQEILISNDENIMIAIPDMFESLEQYTEQESAFWRKYIVLHRDKVNKLLDMSKQYFDTEVTRVYMGVRDKSTCANHFEDFKTVWNGKDVIIVEGAGSRIGIGNDLFSGAKSIERILCPSKNAFDKYDEILEICKQQSKDKLFVLALGPTATVLAYDLAKLGYRALDVGHLDIEYEWMIRGAENKIAIKDKYVNEVKSGRKVTVFNDTTYLNEIIADLSGEDNEVSLKDCLMNILNRLFAVEQQGDTHYLVYLLGFKIKFPKPEFNKRRLSNPYYYYKENNIDIREIPPAEGMLRTIQLANLALLKELDYVCKENGLHYWLDYGTLLGAIRHKGFIPWDDDIDVGMIRDDYDKIVEAFKKSSRNPDIYAELEYIGKSQSIIKIRHSKCSKLFVDIFPRDFMGKVLSQEDRQSFSQVLRRKRQKMNRNKFLNNAKKIATEVKKINSRLFIDNKIDNSDIAYGAEYAYTESIWIQPNEIVYPIKEINFEGVNVMCMNKPEEYLSSIFGNYMGYPNKIGFGHSMYAKFSKEELEVLERLK